MMLRFFKNKKPPNSIVMNTEQALMRPWILTEGSSPFRVLATSDAFSIRYKFWG